MAHSLAWDLAVTSLTQLPTSYKAQKEQDRYVTLYLTGSGPGCGLSSGQCLLLLCPAGNGPPPPSTSRLGNCWASLGTRGRPFTPGGSPWLPRVAPSLCVHTVHAHSAGPWLVEASAGCSVAFLAACGFLQSRGPVFRESNSDLACGECLIQVHE